MHLNQRPPSGDNDSVESFIDAQHSETMMSFEDDGAPTGIIPPTEERGYIGPKSRTPLNLAPLPSLQRHDLRHLRLPLARSTGTTRRRTWTTHLTFIPVRARHAISSAHTW